MEKGGKNFEVLQNYEVPKLIDELCKLKHSGNHLKESLEAQTNTKTQQLTEVEKLSEDSAAQKCVWSNKKFTIQKRKKEKEISFKNTRSKTSRWFAL
jgi:hypothetical protein